MERTQIVDSRGNALVGLLAADEQAPENAPVEAALVVVECEGWVLLVYDRYRAQWELPGGGIEPHETPAQTAIREVEEESGLSLDHVRHLGFARFSLKNPERQEYAALYEARTESRHHSFTPTQEISAITWWNTREPPPQDANPIDIALAQKQRHRPRRTHRAG